MYSGFLEKERKQLKNIRTISWHIVRGYADPKDLPSSVEQWWPIDEVDKDIVNNNPVDISSWTDEKKQAAQETIRMITGG